MSYYSSFPAFTSRQIRPPHLKPGTSPKGTRHPTVPHFPTAPAGGHGPPSGGIGHQINPPRTRGGTPIPGLTPVHQVPGESRNFGRGIVPDSVYTGGGLLGGIIGGGIGRDNRFPPGDGRDRGPIPHPYQLGRTPGDRGFKHLKPQRGEGHFADYFRDRIGFGDTHECNRGQHFEDGHFEFTLCDRNRRFLSNGIAWSVEEAIENAMRFGNYRGDIFDFDRGMFIPPQQFIASPPMLGSGFPVASPFGPSFPPPTTPLPAPPPTNPYIPPPPYDVDTSGRIPTDTSQMMDDGTDTGDGTDSSSTDNTQQQPPPGSGGDGGTAQSITDKLQSMGITMPMLIIGAGLLLVLLVVKK